MTLAEWKQGRFGPRWLEVANGCWVWQGGISGGYPTAWTGERVEKAHRVTWRLANKGKLPAGTDIHHRCGNKRCVNPDHLEALTHLDHAAHHNTHVPDEVVRTIREQYQPGTRSNKSRRGLRAELAERFELHPETVYRIARGQNYGWVK